ncbi:hypothetical protein SAMN04487995_0467 [Dyadobacter koreensis]|uniref:Alpha/beta hydrolase family protein n=1 Tax=Dyadobacter koreensis TaxID=408657 RepID=A0A1H6QIS4_9BACT|nr:alpha/beta hydrolase [Dyadobacter koreensis]SEI40864.1 hypothetical protein SAMN04487995_0467 [Dyadobacter koreensis]
MTAQVIFFHGGGERQDYEQDKNLVVSLKEQLGAAYFVHYPFLQNTGSADLGRREQITREILNSQDGVILVGHSLGASMLLACLSEKKIQRKIGGVFLMATPFWTGDEQWVRPFKLQPDFAEKMDPQVPLFFYHCQDDQEVPFVQLSKYRQKLPWAFYRQCSCGGHDFNNDLAIVAHDIKSLKNGAYIQRFSSDY